jgi:tetratricopeptide (TPR) repeat protein
MIRHFFKYNSNIIKHILTNPNNTFSSLNTRKQIITFPKYMFSYNTNLRRDQVLMLLNDLNNLITRNELYLATEKGIQTVELLQNHPDFIKEHYQATLSLAQAYSGLGQNKQGLDLLENYLTQIDSLFGNKLIKEKESAVINLKDKIAYFYSQTGMLDKSEAFINENISLLEKKLKTKQSTDEKRDAINLCYAYHSLFQVATAMEKSNAEIKSILVKAFNIYSEYPNELRHIGLDIHRHLARINYEDEKFEKAIENYNEVMGILKASEDSDDQMEYEIHMSLANCYDALGESEKVLKEFDTAMINKQNIIGKLKETDPTLPEHYLDLGKLYEAKAEIYMDMNEDNKALENIHEGKKYILKYPTEHINICRSYFVLANIYHNKEMHEKCIENAKKFIKAIDSTDVNEIGKSGYGSEIALINKYRCFKLITESYYNLKDLDKSKKYANITLTILPTIKDAGDVFIQKYEIARLNFLMGNFEETINTYKKVIEIINENKQTSLSDEDDKKIMVFNCWYNIGLAKFEQNKLQEAKEILSKVLTDIIESKVPINEEVKEDINKKLASINMKLTFEKNP